LQISIQIGRLILTGKDKERGNNKLSFLGGVFFPLTTLAKKLLSPIKRLFDRLVSEKNTLAEKTLYYSLVPNCRNANPIIVRPFISGMQR